MYSRLEQWNRMVSALPTWVERLRNFQALCQQAVYLKRVLEKIEEEQSRMVSQTKIHALLLLEVRDFLCSVSVVS